jgi:hypothetical protein
LSVPNFSTDKSLFEKDHKYIAKAPISMCVIHRLNQ